MVISRYYFGLVSNPFAVLAGLKCSLVLITLEMLLSMVSFKNTPAICAATDWASQVTHVQYYFCFNFEKHWIFCTYDVNSLVCDLLCVYAYIYASPLCRHSGGKYWL